MGLASGTGLRQPRMVAVRPASLKGTALQIPESLRLVLELLFIESESNRTCPYLIPILEQDGRFLSLAIQASAVR